MTGQIFHFRIRVDDELNNFDRFRSFLESKGANILLACRETPADENPHFHALVEGKCSLEALRTARKRFFKDEPRMKGNGVASMSECDQIEEFKQYLCKGEKVIKDKTDLKYKNKCNPNIVLNNVGIDVMEYHERFWKRHHSDVPKVHKKNKTFTRQILEDWTLQHGIHISGDVQPRDDEVEPIDELGDEVIRLVDPLQLNLREDVVEWLIDYLGVNEKPWDEFLVVRYANLIHYRYRVHFQSYVHVRRSQCNSILQKLGCSTD